jgi:hypothetical protein
MVSSSVSFCMPKTLDGGGPAGGDEAEQVVKNIQPAGQQQVSLSSIY